MSDQSNAAGGVGFTGLLTIVFITLKLCGVINWSWWWVLSPLWISLGLFLLLCALALLVGTAAATLAVILENRK
jgi:ABC-type nickel/cobalt efflux system permease component RcnA